jgi:hypothetical protein
MQGIEKINAMIMKSRRIKIGANQNYQFRNDEFTEVDQIFGPIFQ